MEFGRCPFLAALDARNDARGTVKFDHPPTAAQLVQAVDVLSDHGGEFAHVFELGNCVMPGVGLGVGELFVQLDPRLPITNPCRTRGDKLVVVDRFVPIPKTAGTTKIGNTTLCAYSRAGKGYAVSGLDKVFC